MFDIGWTELMVIGVVALIVIGPKDLPEMFRTLGRFTAKAKGMAREFSRAMESAADESGIKDVASDLRKATSAKSMGLDVVKDAASKFEAWDPMKSKPAAAPMRDPSAPKPEAPKGPETKALADAQATKRAERAAAAAPVPQAETAKPAAKTPAAKTVAAKPPVAAKAGKKPAAKKPAIKTPISEKPTSKKPVLKKPIPTKSDV
jgi:sec-independent protein translocase protein TatB